MKLSLVYVLGATVPIVTGTGAFIRNGLRRSLRNTPAPVVIDPVTKHLTELDAKFLELSNEVNAIDEDLTEIDKKYEDKIAILVAYNESLKEEMAVVLELVESSIYKARKEEKPVSQGRSRSRRSALSPTGDSPAVSVSTHNGGPPPPPPPPLPPAGYFAAPAEYSKPQIRKDTGRVIKKPIASITDQLTKNPMFLRMSKQSQQSNQNDSDSE